MKLQGNGMCEKSHKGIKEAMEFRDRWPKAQRRSHSPERKVFSHQGATDPASCTAQIQCHSGSAVNNLGFRLGNGANMNLPRARV